MATGRYSKQIAPNKHNVLEVLYKQAGHHINHNANTTILLGEYPNIAIRRALGHIVGDNKVLVGYEISPKCWALLKGKKIFQNKGQMLRRCDKPDVSLYYIHGDVTWAPSTTFEDIDLCATWTCHKKEVKNTIDDDSWKQYIRAASPVNLLTTRLAMQRRLKERKKVFMGTVSLRNGINKKFTYRCLNHILHVLGWTIADIDDVKDGYGKGNTLAGSSSVFVDKRKYYAKRHEVGIYPLYDVENPVSHCSMKMFTYTDTQPMQGGD